MRRAVSAMQIFRIAHLSKHGKQPIMRPRDNFPTRRAVAAFEVLSSAHA